jgi:hypothetical protein
MLVVFECQAEWIAFKENAQNATGIKFLSIRDV